MHFFYSLLLFLFLSFAATNCTKIDSRESFEEYLNKFIGGTDSDVMREFGRENITFENKMRADGKQATVIIFYEEYYFGKTKYWCKISFAMGEAKSIITDWDYEGNGCF